jgi:ribonucleoside-diphosphate reductase alpha chain
LAEQPVVGDVWYGKYRYTDEVSLDDTFLRVGETLFGGEPALLARYLESTRHREIVPAGRILAGAGTDKRVTLINCFVSPDIQDSLRTDPGLPGLGIMDALAVASYTQQMGGGIGMDFSTLRPRGAVVRRTQSVSSGVVPFMHQWDAMCATIRSAGNRRGAMMATLGIWHPDVRELVRAKTRSGVLTNFNVSVMVPDAFMQALERDGDWDLYFPVPRADGRHRERSVPKFPMPFSGISQLPSYVYETVRARDLWDEIIGSTYVHAEPGVIFIDRVNEQNNLRYCEQIHCTNPCVVGETLIAVAGRGPVPIRQLAAEGDDVPVFALDPATGETVVRWGRRPRLTGRNVPTVRVVLDDGSHIRCTPDHRFPLRDGHQVEAQSLSPGDSLFRIDQIVTRKGDVSVSRRGGGEKVPEYHLIAEAKYRTRFDWGRRRGQYHCHHVDGNHQNNDWDNIEVKLAEDHNSDHKAGDANPMRFWWDQASEEERQAYRDRMRASTSGERNGMWGRRHSAETRRKIGGKTSERMATGEARRRHGDAVRAGHTAESWAKMSAAAKARYRTLEKVCAGCGAKFVVRARSSGSGAGKRKYCSQSCAASAIAQSIDNRGRRHSPEAIEKMRAARLRYYHGGEDQNHNHTVVAVLPDAPANVYNLTVDEHHNYAIITSEEFVARHGHVRYSGIKILNCGEQVLPQHGCCNLGHTNLAVMVDRPFEAGATFNFERLKSAAALMVNLLDRVLDVTLWPTEQQAEEARQKRRIGLGFTGLASALQQLGVAYGSPDAVSLTREIARRQAIAAYSASVELARERGPFPLFDALEFCRSPFIQNLPCDLQADIAKYGTRNGVLLSVAPTGTTSLVMGNVSSGIEPVFDHRYRRRMRDADGELTLEYDVFDYGYLRFHEHHGCDPRQADQVMPLPDYFVTSADLTVRQHLEMQAAAQEWIDSSISKTINCPVSMTFDEFRGVYDMAYELGLKSCTTYRPDPASSRGAILSTNSTGAPEEEGRPAVAPLGEKIPMQDVVEGRRYRIKWPDEDCAYYIMLTDFVSSEGQRRPFEIFISTKSARHDEWIKALSLMITGIFRRGGDPIFVVEELRQVFSARGGTWLGGRYVPSLVAAIAEVIAEHFRWLGLMDPGEVLTELPEQGSVVNVTESMAFCEFCGLRAVVHEAGCAVCRACGHSDCG